MAERAADGAVIAFAGPTLPAAPDRRWRRLLERIEVRPPAQRGDVLNALCNEPHTLVVLDGYYFTVPAVTHKEILYALDAGVRVIGAASMGALRAAELAEFGMEGVGRIFEQYHAGEIDGDDEVAVLHAPADLGFRPLTVALVDVRAALAELLATAAAPFPAARADELVAVLKALPFGERHLRRLQRLAEELLGAAGARALEERLRHHGRKERDARRALERALEEPPRPRTRPATAATTFLGHFHEWHLEVPGGGESKCTFQQAAHALQVLHPRAGEALGALRRRFLLASAARRAGRVAAEERVRELSDRLGEALRRLHGHPLLPVPERLAEARDEELAAAARRHFGGEEAALAFLAEGLGLPAADAGRHLEELLRVQDDLMPGWTLVRGLAVSRGFPLAVETARAAARIHRAFQSYKQGARIRLEDLTGLAAELWGCTIEEVGAEAASRGLFDAGGFSPGLRPALELVAAAERLPRPINDYPRLRDALRQSPLESLPEARSRQLAQA